MPPRLNRICILKCCALALVLLAAVPAPRCEPYIDTERKVNEQLYIVRHCTLINRLKPWAAAVRELVRIGEPAVPGICRELLRDDPASSQAALMMALRAIGDERAIPALIRRLELGVPPGGSDFAGLCTGDVSLDRFMRRIGHEPASPENRFTLGQPANELCLALEKLTGHSEGSDYVFARMGAGVSALEADALRRELADRQRKAAARWRAWWQMNNASILDANQFAEAEAWANPSSIDPVEQAGIDALGPMLPVGPDIEFGRPIELVLHLSKRAGDWWDDYGVDFDRGVPVSLPAQPMDPAAMENWRDRNGVDAVALAMPPDMGLSDPNTAIATLAGFDCLVWPVDNGRWETIERDLRAGMLQASEPGDDFHAENGLETTQTFLFRTRENGFGIVQMLGFTPDRYQSGVRIRFKMLAQGGYVTERQTGHESDRIATGTGFGIGPFFPFDRFARLRVGAAWSVGEI